MCVLLCSLYNKNFKWYPSILFCSNMPIFAFSSSISLYLAVSLFVCFYFVCGVEYTQSAVQHAKFTHTQFCHYLNIRLSSIRKNAVQTIHSTGTDKSTLIKELVAVETNPIFIACKCWSIVIGMQTSLFLHFYIPLKPHSIRRTKKIAVQSIQLFENKPNFGMLPTKNVADCECECV